MTEFSNRITKSQAEFLAQTKKQLFIWSNIDTGEYIFSDGRAAPREIENEIDDWSSCSYRFPSTAAPRKGLEDGKVITLDDYLLVFKVDDKELPFEDYCCTTNKDREELMDSFDEAMKRINK